MWKGVREVELNYGYEREREKDRQIDRQIGRQIDRQREREKYYLHHFRLRANPPPPLFLLLQVVQEYERAVIFRLGRLLKGGAKGPGIFFVVPCIDSYRKVDLRTVSFDVPPQEVKYSVPFSLHFSFRLNFVIDPFEKCYVYKNFFYQIEKNIIYKFDDFLFVLTCSFDFFFPLIFFRRGVESDLIIEPRRVHKNVNLIMNSKSSSVPSPVIARLDLAPLILDCIRRSRIREGFFRQNWSLFSTFYSREIVFCFVFFPWRFALGSLVQNCRSELRQVIKFLQDLMNITKVLLYAFICSLFSYGHVFPRVFMEQLYRLHTEW